MNMLALVIGICICGLCVFFYTIGRIDGKNYMKDKYCLWGLDNAKN